MADDKKEERLRERAYSIWEREGRPHGRHEDHWHQANQEEVTPDQGGAQPQEGEAAQQRPKGRGGARKKAAASTEAPVEPPVGLSTGLQPGGTIPGAGPGVGAGSIGTGGGSTGGTPTGTLGRKKRT